MVRLAGWLWQSGGVTLFRGRELLGGQSMVDTVLHLILITRHSADFDPLGEQLYPGLSPYTESFHDYVQKRYELAQLVGTDQFIWCVDERCPLRHYESVKPIEWHIKVDVARILGFVSDHQWDAFLKGHADHADGVLSRVYPPGNGYSVLVRFPIRRDELVKRIRYHVHSPDKADIVEEEFFDSDAKKIQDKKDATPSC